MKNCIIRLFAAILLCLVTVASFVGCETESSNSGETGGSVKIKSIKYEDDTLIVTYDDGYQIKELLSEVAVQYATHVTLSIPSSTEESEDHKQIVTTISQKYSASVVGTSRYILNNGEPVKDTESQLVTRTIYKDQKIYEPYDNKIAEHIKNNLTNATVKGTVEDIFDSFNPGGILSENSSIHVGGLTTQTVSITQIASGAFADLPKLESVTLPDKIQKISVCAFYNSPKLTEIIFEGTVEQWNAIEKEDGWDYGAADFTVRCSDGEIKMQETD